MRGIGVNAKQLRIFLPSNNIKRQHHEDPHLTLELFPSWNLKCYSFTTVGIISDVKNVCNII